MKSNIALIGFMATGKSTIGKILAEKLGKKFIEMDELIELEAGKTIPELFAISEITFREYEMAICKNISKMENSVISTGGGVILNKLNIDYLKESSIVILLETSLEKILERAINEGKEKRPLLNKPDPKGEAEKLLIFRKPFYHAASNVRINTNKGSIEEIVEQIIQIFNKQAE